MSFVAWIARRRIRSTFAKRIRPGMSPEATLQIFVDGLDKLTAGQPDITRKVGVTVASVGGEAFAADLVRTDGAREDHVVLLLHGGAYLWGRPRHFHPTALYLSRDAGARVLVVDYPLAPEHRFPRQLEVAEAAYAHLLDEGVPARQIAILGDSAGGNLALALAQRLVATRAASERPGALVLFSPWLDLTGSGESVRTRAKTDVMLSAQAGAWVGQLFAGGVALDDPRVSPLFGAMGGLPPTHLQVSNDELLLDDAVRAAERMTAAGVRAELKVWPGLWHDFQQAAGVVPEGRQALREAASFIRAVWGT